MTRIALFTVGKTSPELIASSEELALRLRDYVERFTHTKLHLEYDYDEDLRGEYEAGYKDGLRDAL